MAHLPRGGTPKTREEAIAKAEMIDGLADNETEDEVEYHRLRAKAAAMRETAERLPSEAAAKG